MSKVLYIIMNDICLGKNHSGPTVRSLEMLKELKNKYPNLDVIMGENPKERFLSFKALEPNEKYDFCYVELKVGVTRYYDTLLLTSIRRKFKEIRIGMYYRDMYWAYGIKMSKGYLKNLIVPLANKYYLKFISSIADVIFGQSGSFCNQIEPFISNKCKLDILSPGCENTELKKNSSYKNDSSGVIYVGEIDEVFSGVELLLESMLLVNKEQYVPLYLVCRKHEYNQSELLQKANEEYKWLNIEHHTKETIEQAYEKASLAIIPRYKNDYTKLCLPIKLFEYITHELPIVAVKHGEVSTFIEKHKVGFVTSPDVNQVAKSVLSLVKDPVLTKEIRENLITAKMTNSWGERVNRIHQVLGG